jgi:hypothetical protein
MRDKRFTMTYNCMGRFYTVILKEICFPAGLIVLLISLGLHYLLELTTFDLILPSIITSLLRAALHFNRSILDFPAKQFLLVSLIESAFFWFSFDLNIYLALILATLRTLIGMNMRMITWKFNVDRAKEDFIFVCVEILVSAFFFPTIKFPVYLIYSAIFIHRIATDQILNKLTGKLKHDFLWSSQDGIHLCFWLYIVFHQQPLTLEEGKEIMGVLDKIQSKTLATLMVSHLKFVDLFQHVKVLTILLDKDYLICGSVLNSVKDKLTELSSIKGKDKILEVATKPEVILKFLD